MIDTHSHIYLEEFDRDLAMVIASAKKTGVKQILLPNVDVSTINRMHLLEQAEPDFCKAMMGIHPTSIKEDYKKQLDTAKQHLKLKPYIAVGEIGIDLYWDKTFINEQIDAFEQQIIWAKELDLPVVIHCRNAFNEVFAVVERQLDNKLRGVFHSFTGDVAEAHKIMEYENFAFGINGVVSFKNTHLREVLKAIPLNKVVMETDAPYLAPVPYRGKRNEPSYILKVAETLTQVYDLPIQRIIAQTSENASKIFNL